MVPPESSGCSGKNLFHYVVEEAEPLLKSSISTKKQNGCDGGFVRGVLSAK
jgi:hypothetical protein